jgi:hypothetical protein
MTCADGACADVDALKQRVEEHIVRMDTHMNANIRWDPSMVGVNLYGKRVPYDTLSLIHTEWKKKLSVPMVNLQDNEKDGNEEVQPEPKPDVEPTPEPEPELVPVPGPEPEPTPDVFPEPAPPLPPLLPLCTIVGRNHERCVFGEETALHCNSRGEARVCWRAHSGFTDCACKET